MLPKYLKLYFNSPVCQGNWFVYFRFKLTKRVLGTVCLCVFCLKKVIVFYFNLAVSEERNKEKHSWMVYSECYSFSSITCRNTKSITKRKTAVSPLNQFKRSSKQRKSKWKKWEGSVLTARHVTWGGGQRGCTPVHHTRPSGGDQRRGQCRCHRDVYRLEWSWLISSIFHHSADTTWTLNIYILSV